jgi:cytochrome c-type biogenesis protein CcmH/NrfG
MLGLGKLLGAPFTLPMAGMKFVFQQVADLADQELNDESTLREQLLLLQVQLEDGDIEEDEFAEREAEILGRLRAIKERKLASASEIPAEANVDARRRFVVETPLDEE